MTGNSRVSNELFAWKREIHGYECDCPAGIAFNILNLYSQDVVSLTEWRILQSWIVCLYVNCQWVYGSPFLSQSFYNYLVHGKCTGHDVPPEDIPDRLL